MYELPCVPLYLVFQFGQLVLHAGTPVLPSRSCHQLTRQTLVHWSTCYTGILVQLVYWFTWSASPLVLWYTWYLVYIPSVPVHLVMSPFTMADPSKLTRLTQDRHQLRPFCDHQWCHHLSDNATVQPAFATSLWWIEKVFKRHKWRHQSPSLPATPSLYIYKLTRRKEVNCLGPALQSTFAWFLSWNTQL